MTDQLPSDDLWAPGIPDDAAAVARMQPHDREAEMSVLGACMLDRGILLEILRDLDPEDFYEHRHGLILDCYAAMVMSGQPVDQLTLIQHLEKTGNLEKIGGRSYVFQLVQAVPATAMAPWYAERVQGLALRRALAEQSTRTAAEALSGMGEPTDLVEQAVARFREIRDRGRAATDEHIPNIDEFLSVEHSHDWLVPGLIERRDRTVFTGAEGAGKSVLSRQMAMCISAGIHPFTHSPIETGPGTVLVIDCENGELASSRHYRPLRQIAEQHTKGSYDPNRLRILCRPEGLDLTKAMDRAYVMRKVESIRPDFLVIGPVYRLHAGDPNSEELARKVSVVIDEARAAADCAVWMEAHAPHHNGFNTHRALRPVGSSLWMRWPEFGYGIRLADDETAKQERLMNVVSWRGPREERSWPVQIKQGADWPWVRVDPRYHTGW